MYNPQLETFLCVAECGSFNKAAEKLFISPPAVIKQINLLEENLDLQLFVRTHRGLQLTEAGTGRKIHHPILQRFGDQGKKCHEKERRHHPYRYIIHDTSSGFGGSVAKTAGGVSRS